MAAGHEVVLVAIGHRQAVGHERIVARLLQHLAIMRRCSVVRGQQGHRGRVWRVRGIIHGQQVAAVGAET